jgi:hypothetical protein
MRLTPRGNEVKAVVELLESDDFDSGSALAKAIIKRVAEMFAERDWSAWVWRENGDEPYFQLAWGPFSSETEAKRMSVRVGLKGQHMILPLYSTAALMDRLSAETIPSQFCSSCSHSLISHEHPKIQPKCAVKGCSCKRKATE